MSSKEVLSESELDALMDSVSSGDVSVDGEVSGQEFQPFDFSSREQVLLAQMPALETLNEKHSLAYTQEVRDTFKIPVEIEMGDVQLLKLDSAIEAIAEPSGINILKITPLIGVSFVVFPGELLSFFVDRYFGGAANSTEFKYAPRPDLTPTEKRMNDLLLDKFLVTLQGAWAGKIPVASEIVGFETKPEFVQGGAPGELALAFSFGVKVGEWASNVSWLVPYAAFELLRPKLGSPGVSSTATQESNWEDFFRRELLEVELEVRGVFTTRNVSFAELLSLKKGSIVPLKMPSEVSVWIEGKRFSTGEHGSNNGNKSIKIGEILA